MSITLRDLVARKTPLEWFEAVAIAQELGATVMGTAGAAGPRVPDLPDAVLTPDGTMEVRDGGPPDQSAVFRLAHVLNALMATSTPPVPLRLIVLTALSPESTYHSLLELTQALEYFERPDRRLVARAVHDRAQRLPAPTVEQAVAPLPATPPVAAQLLRPKVDRRRFVRVTIAVVLLAAGAGAGVWWWRSRPTGPRVFAAATKGVSQAVASAVEAVKGTFGSKPAVVDEQAVAATPAAAPPAPAGRRATRFIRPGQTFAHGRLTALTAGVPSVGAPVRPLDAAVEAPAAGTLEGAVGTAGGVAPVYSLADADVRPPVAVRPRLPSEPPPGVAPKDLTQVEAVISPTGEVESVKIVAGPRTPMDGMMLSAVKAWKFQPALKDGRPVSYRQVLRLTQ